MDTVYDIIITSNSKKKDKHIRINHDTVNVLAIASFLIFSLFIGIVFDYVYLQENTIKFKLAELENEQLIKKYNTTLLKLSSAQKSLQKIEDTTRKINKITDQLNNQKLLFDLIPSAYEAQDAVTKKELVTIPLYLEKQPRADLITRESLFFKHPILENQSETVIFNPKNDITSQTETALFQSQTLEQEILQQWAQMSEQKNILQATPIIKPAEGWFSSQYGYRRDPITKRRKMHSGLDIVAPRGTVIKAPADGKIKYAGRKGSYGNVVVISHGYGLETRFAHLSKILVKKGQSVNRYQTIGRMGNTGRSTGTHLHYEVRIKGVAVDPINYILEI